MLNLVGMGADVGASASLSRPWPARRAHTQLTVGKTVAELSLAVHSLSERRDLTSLLNSFWHAEYTTSWK